MEKFYCVIYLSDGTIHLWPGDTQEACLDTAQQVVALSSMKDRVIATTVIKRDLSNFKTVKNCPMLFGIPKVYDVTQPDFKMPTKKENKQE